jgi:DNA-binding transcriptional regulator YdaS (Cro superfamily)
MDLGALTVKQAQVKLTELAEEHERLRARIDQARRRIHEFAPATRDYEIAEQGLALDDIDAEFYAACRRSTDPAAMAQRFGVPEETIRQWGNASHTTPEPRVVRIEAMKDGLVHSYAMPFRPSKKQEAQDLLNRFSETLTRRGWQVSPQVLADCAESYDITFAEL